MEDIAERADKSTLNKRLRSRHLIGIGIGNILGTGIFTLTGIEARDHAGPAVVIAFAIGALVAGLAALSYAELASSVPTAGSAYSYTFATLGEAMAWIIGWDLLLEFALGVAVVARGWSSYLQNLFALPSSVFGEDSVVNLGAIAVIVALTAVSVLGVRQSAGVTNALVVVKVAVCLLVIAVGLFFVRKANLTPFVPPARAPDNPGSGLDQSAVYAVFGVPQSVYGIAGVLTSAAVVFFAYAGFESMANLGEETKRPSRDMPIGLIGALTICGLLYVGVSFVATGMVPFAEIDRGAPIAAAFDSVGLRWVGVIIAIGAICGLTSVILVDLITVGRVGFTMARDGLLPGYLAKTHPRSGIPARMTVVGAVPALLLAALVPLTDLANMVSIGALSAMLAVSIAVPVLRKRRPDLARPFKVPLSPVLPVIAAAACVYLMLNLPVMTWLTFAAWIGAGLVIYWGYGRRNSVLRRRR